MQNSLSELKQKQRKLLYHFGETLYNLYRADSIDFVFPAGNAWQEQETSKLLKLLNYMTERVRKFEELASREETVEAVAEPVPEVQSSVAELPVPSLGDTVLDEEKKPMDEKSESVPEAPLGEKEGIRWEEAGPAESEGSSSTSRSIVEVEQVSETLSGGSLAATLTETLEEKAEEEARLSPEALVEQETSQLAAQFPDEAPTQAAVSVTFQGLLESVRFKSETEQRLFEENLDVLRNGQEKERVRALKNVSYLVGKTTFKDVCGLVMKDPGPAVRIAALKTLGRTRDPESLDLYRTGLQDEDAGVRIACVKGLSMLLLKDCVPVIEPMGKDPDARVRGMTVTYLGIYGGPQGVQLASEAWKDEDAYVRKSLVDMLAIVRAPGTFSVIKQLLDDTDEGVRRSAANALNKSKVVETKE